MAYKFRGGIMNANDVISIISYTISSNIPDIEDIYKEEVPQGMSTPSFFIYLINSEQDKLLNNRYKRLFKVAIKYFTDKKDEINQDMYSVADKLTEILEQMEYDNKIIKGRNMEYKILDDVLHFYFDVDNKLIKKTDSNKFGPLEVDVNVT